MPSPIKPQPLFASTAAVAGPPMRGCRISIMLVNTTGNSAIVPLTLGPTHFDKVTTVATRVATSEARSRISYQRSGGRGTRGRGPRKAGGPRRAEGERRDKGKTGAHLDPSSSAKANDRVITAGKRIVEVCVYWMPRLRGA